MTHAYGTLHGLQLHPRHFTCQLCDNETSSHCTLHVNSDTLQQAGRLLKITQWKLSQMDSCVDYGLKPWLQLLWNGVVNFSTAGVRAEIWHKTWHTVVLGSCFGLASWDHGTSQVIWSLMAKLVPLSHDSLFDLLGQTNYLRRKIPFSLCEWSN